MVEKNFLNPILHGGGLYSPPIRKSFGPSYRLTVGYPDFLTFPKIYPLTLWRHIGKSWLGTCCDDVIILTGADFFFITSTMYVSYIIAKVIIRRSLCKKNYPILCSFAKVLAVLVVSLMTSSILGIIKKCWRQQKMMTSQFWKWVEMKV